MPDNLANFFTLLQAVLTLFGFALTYNLNRRNVKEEINKLKTNFLLDKVSDLPYEIQQLLDGAIEGRKDIVAEFKKLIKKIFAYGSKEAIALTTNMQELNYRLAKEPNSAEKNTVIAYYILLLCQVKYDLTGTKISPQYWYRLRFVEYGKIKMGFDEANNKIVKQLGLSSFLLVK